MLINHLNGVEPKVFKDFPYSRYAKTDDVSWELDVLGKPHPSSGKQLCLFPM
jgi:DNA (cytosine-5)-methyltransferase 1